jgi:hypothetical protein
MSENLRSAADQRTTLPRQGTARSAPSNRVKWRLIDSRVRRSTARNASLVSLVEQHRVDLIPCTYRCVGVGHRDSCRTKYMYQNIFMHSGRVLPKSHCRYPQKFAISAFDYRQMKKKRSQSRKSRATYHKAYLIIYACAMLLMESKVFEESSIWNITRWSSIHIIRVFGVSLMSNHCETAHPKPS